MDQPGRYSERKKKGLELSDRGANIGGVIELSKLTNGNVSNENLNGLEVRIQNFIYLKYVLLDHLRPLNNREMATFEWRQNSEKEPVFDARGLPEVNPDGTVKKKYYPKWHSIATPLEHQRPELLPCPQVFVERESAARRFGRPVVNGRTSGFRESERAAFPFKWFDGFHSAAE